MTDIMQLKQKLGSFSKDELIEELYGALLAVTEMQVEITSLRRAQPRSSSGGEEMENYRMALAYISKQSSDPQSRELAETALDFGNSHSRPLRPQGE